MNGGVLLSLSTHSFINANEITASGNIFRILDTRKRFFQFLWNMTQYINATVIPVNAGTLSITLLAESPKAEGIFENRPQKPRNVTGMNARGTRGLGTYPLFILILSSIFRNSSCFSFV